MRIITIAFTVLGITFSLSQTTIAASEHQWVPKYHFAPEKGWINDPNGLSYYKGYYHIFYQYNPNDAVWGLMHWGHARSKDMLSWEHLPIALAPSLPEDIDGIFSGSAVNNDGNLSLIYTGVSGTHQVQCLATSSDGEFFVKEGVVLRKDGDDADFRDPKAWYQNGSWYVIIGSKTTDNKGEALLFKSPNLHTWESQGVFAQADDKLGYMWECPDVFMLGNKHILIVNPQGMQQDGYDYQNLYQTGYFVGTWVPGHKYKIEKEFREIDHGPDFYASQTFLAPDGRRIQIAWMAMWESVFPEAASGWSGMFTLPRELTLSSSGDLEVRPIREIKDRRMGNPKKVTAFVVNNTYAIVDEGVYSKEIIIDFNLPDTTAEKFGLRIGDSAVSDAGVQVYVNYTESRLFLERYYPDYNIIASSRSVPINLNKTLSLDIFVDSSSIEVFVNDGQAVLSSRIYPNDDERFLSLFSLSGLFIFSNYSSWDL